MAIALGLSTGGQAVVDASRLGWRERGGHLRKGGGMREGRKHWIVKEVEGEQEEKET